MNDLSELFWNASLEEIKQGFLYLASEEKYLCLICGQSFEKGRIYSMEDQLYEAQKYIQHHIAQTHGPVFNFLIGLDKKITGLTKHQKDLLTFFYQGFSDPDIAKEMGMGSTSTVRNHRFSLREKQKQAKLFLAIMELLEQRSPKQFISIPRTSPVVDERFAITHKENEKILNTYFTEGLDGPISIFPLKEKRKVAILKHIMQRFETNKNYSEKEVNEILKKVYHDYVTLRRYLIEYGFLDRKKDGSAYWVKV